MIDTNVPIVANGSAEPESNATPTLECRLAAIDFLSDVLSQHIVVLDLEGDIQSEYSRYLSPRGQPGVGDRFYLEIINSHPDRIHRISLQKDDLGEYLALPNRLKQIGFDPSDRKFAALAKLSNSTIANAVDTDWVNSHAELVACDISVINLCGCDPNAWYAAD